MVQIFEDPLSRQSNLLPGFYFVDMNNDPSLLKQSYTSRFFILNCILVCWFLSGKHSIQ